jgi:protein-L-isoaspartate(D-aspartate) O-methyltransferase
VERLADFREVFAEVVLSRAGIRNARLREAFAKVPRHEFVGPGPWHLSETGEPTLSTDPALLYQDMVVGLAPERGITTGLPSLHARCLHACAPQAGESVVHIGAGTGYYTAILAELVGPTGSVTAFEIDPALAARASARLQEWPSVVVHHSSGIELPAEAADLIYVCAGVQRLPRAWLDGLRPGGRLGFPLTPGDGEGGFLLVRQLRRGIFSARFLCPARFFPCTGAQEPTRVASLAQAFHAGGLAAVRSLKRSPEPPDESCWYAGDGWWLSTRDVELDNEPRH